MISTDRPDADAVRPPLLGIPLVGAVLILLWFVPELLTASPVFSFQIIAETTGWAKFVLLCPPIAGSLLLLLFAVNRRNRLVRLLTFAVAAAAAAPLAVLGGSSVHPSIIAEIAAPLLTACAIAAGAKLHRRPALFYSALLALPLLLEVFALVQAATGAVPAAYLGPYKLPIALFCTSAAAAHALSEGLRR